MSRIETCAAVVQDEVGDDWKSMHVGPRLAAERSPGVAPPSSLVRTTEPSLPRDSSSYLVRAINFEEQDRA